MRVSKLVLYSYGIVAANKPLSSMEIEVTPVEEVQMTNGELTDSLSTTNSKGKDADGASFETSTHSSATLTARWLPFSSNRRTAPDVRRGEKVAIWKFADADKYYWEPLEYNGKLRKLETVIYQFSDTKDEAAEATPDNTYYIEISTHNKLIHIHTSTSDGEPYGYDIVLNAKEGNFQIRDTLENIFFLDTGDKRFVLKNADGSYIDLFGKDLFINIVNDVVWKVGGNMTIDVAAAFAMKAGASWKVTTPKADFVTPQLTTSEKFTSGDDGLIGGKLTIAKSLATGSGGGGGETTIGGTITVQGSLQASGTGTFSGNVNAPNIR